MLPDNPNASAFSKNGGTLPVAAAIRPSSDYMVMAPKPMNVATAFLDCMIRLIQSEMD